MNSNLQEYKCIYTEVWRVYTNVYICLNRLVIPKHTWATTSQDGRYDQVWQSPHRPRWSWRCCYCRGKDCWIEKALGWSVWLISWTVRCNLNCLHSSSGFLALPSEKNNLTINCVRPLDNKSSRKLCYLLECSKMHCSPCLIGWRQSNPVSRAKRRSWVTPRQFLFWWITIRYVWWQTFFLMLSLV